MSGSGTRVGAMVIALLAMGERAVAGGL